MTPEEIKNPDLIDEESKKNHEILMMLLLAIDLALEIPKNRQRLDQIWQENDPTYKKWLEEQKKRPSESVAETQKA